MNFLRIALLCVMSAATLAGCGGSTNATIGGTVSGLASGSTITLTNSSNGDTVKYTYSSSSNSFTFPKSVIENSNYNVTVTAIDPAGQLCTVANGVGTVNSSGSNVTNITVTCTAGNGTAVPVIASVAGLANGSQLVLTSPAAGVLTVIGNATTAVGGTVPQNFPVSLLPNAIFTVSIQTQPVGQTCTFLNGISSGTVPSSGSPNIGVSCQ